METALVVGFTRRTSYALARYLISVKKYRVVVSDRAVDDEKIALLAELQALGAAVSALGDQSTDLLSRYRPALVFLSPGVPQTIPLIQEAKVQGIPLLNDIEYFAQEFPQRTIAAVTGTDGKTTTATWLHHVISLQFPAVLAGNIGTPIFTFADSQYEEHMFVLELSSFQLELVNQFHARAGVILNIAPDHLDRYPSFEAYGAVKKNIFANMQAGDLALLNGEDAFTPSYEEGLNAQTEYFCYNDVNCHWSAPDGDILQQGKLFFQGNQLQVLGRHQRQNAMAVSALALFLGVHEDLVRKGLASFTGVEYRLQYLGEKQGVRFYNDSKATSPQALTMALNAFDQKVILLAGGQSKGVAFTSLAPLIAQKTQKVVPFGALSLELAQAWGLEPQERTLEEAFKEAYAYAQEGDIILFAPGGTSWDAFANYEERGRLFTQLVAAL